MKDYENAFGDCAKDIMWNTSDLNGDGIDDLIWQRSLSNGTQQKPIVGIFTFLDEQLTCVFWDTIDNTEYYFIGNTGSLGYYTYDSGNYSEEHFFVMKMDDAFHTTVLEALSIYNFFEDTQIDT